MKANIFIVLFFSLNLYAQDWLQKADYPLAKRDDGVSFTINGKAYCGTGLDNGFSPTSNFQAFDFNSETWQNVQSLPNGKERQYATATSFNGKGYVFGGSNNSNSLNDLWQYDPSTDTWTELSNLPDLGRGGCSSFILNNQWYIIGGKIESGAVINEVWAFNFLTETWIQKSNIPNMGTWRGIAFSSSTKGFLGLGIDSLGNFNTQFWEYSPLPDTWTINTNFSTVERTYPSYAQIGDTVFMYGGLSSSGELLNTFERIELNTQTITPLTDLTSFPRKGCMAFCSLNAFYLTTGVTATSRTKETWKASYILGVDNATITKDISIYQKENYLHVKSEIPIQKVTLYSAVGIKVLEEMHSSKINVQRVPFGIYFYSIEAGNETIRGKIYIR